MSIVAPFLFIPIQYVYAQSPTMPIPLAVVKDADGKLIGQIENAGEIILIDINGATVPFRIKPTGLVTVQLGQVPIWVPGESGGYYKSAVFELVFSGPDCTGNVFMAAPEPFGMAIFNRANYAVWGPDPFTGEYRVFKSTSTDPNLNAAVYSAWVWETDWDDFSFRTICKNTDPGQLVYAVSAAVEVLPNPLAGFHGPTDANPERVLTIQGGNRLP